MMGRGVELVMRRILQLLSAPQSSPLDDQRRMGWRPLTLPDQQWKGRPAIARRGLGAPDEIGSRHCSSRQPQFAQYARPIAFRPISQAPAVQATGEQLQVIFFADADRAMNGMGNGSNLTCRETGAMLGDGGVSQLWLKSRTRADRGCNAGGHGLFGQNGQLLLHRLLLADGLAELDAFIGIGD